MPLRVYLNDKEQWIHPSEDWQELTNGTLIDDLRVDENFYVKVVK
jgi:hypothetical protein